MLIGAMIARMHPRRQGRRLRPLHAKSSACELFCLGTLYAFELSPSFGPLFDGLLRRQGPKGNLTFPVLIHHIALVEAHSKPVSIPPNVRNSASPSL